MSYWSALTELACSPQHSYFAGAKRLHWLMLGFFKRLQQILFSLLTKTNTETFLSMNPCLSLLDFDRFPVSQLISEWWFQLLKTHLKRYWVWFQQNLSAICLLMSEPKPSSPTQIYIYPSCLGLVGAVTDPAPTTANGSTVASQVRC